MLDNVLSFNMTLISRYTLEDTGIWLFSRAERISVGRVEGVRISPRLFVLQLHDSELQ